MPRTPMNAGEVAAMLGLPVHAVRRFAESGVLPGRQIKSKWQFRAGEISNWAATHVAQLASCQPLAPAPEAPPFCLASALKPELVLLPLVAHSRFSVLDALASAAHVHGLTPDPRRLLESLVARESQSSTALSCGAAIPHAQRLEVAFAGTPAIVAARTATAIPFGDRTGGLTDLFFLLMCPDHREHLRHLARLCRLLNDADLITALRAAQSVVEFIAALNHAEAAL